MRLVFVHGFPGFSQVGPVSYFQGVADHLRQKFQNLNIIAPALGFFGFATTKERAAQLADAINTNFPGEEKVHLIAHSGGGIDARLLTGLPPNGLGLGSAVATITTISSPHHGSAIAELLSNPLTIVADVIPGLDDLARAVEGFTPANMTTFEQQVTPDTNVKIRTYAGTRPTGLFLASAAFIPGESDGWIGVDEARFGTFLDTIPANHLEEVGLDLTPGTHFNHLAFYEQLVADLGAVPR